MSLLDAHSLYLAHEVDRLHESLEDVRSWPPSDRRDAILSSYETTLEEWGEVVDEIAARAEEEREAHEGEAEISAALGRAVDEARRVGCVMVDGAAQAGAQLMRTGLASVAHRHGVTIWTARIDGGEVRLALKAGSYRGALTWRAC